MSVDIDEGNLREGILGVVIALCEIIRDALSIQAFKRMERGRLTEEECERLGQALMDLDNALEEIKEEQEIEEEVQGIRDGLGDVVDGVVDQIANPHRWSEEIEQKVKEASKKCL